MRSRDGTTKRAHHRGTHYRGPRTRAPCARAGVPAQACGSACAVCQRPRTGHCCFSRAESIACCSCASDEGFIKDFTRRSAPRPCCHHASPCPSTPAARPPPPPAPHRQRLTSALPRRRSGWAGTYEWRVVRQPASNRRLTSAPRSARKRGRKRRAHRSCSAASRAASLPCPSICRITSCNRSSRSSARAFSEFSTAAKCASFSLESKQPTTSEPFRRGK